MVRVYPRLAISTSHFTIDGGGRELVLEGHVPAWGHTPREPCQKLGGHTPQLVLPRDSPAITDFVNGIVTPEPPPAYRSIRPRGNSVLRTSP